MRQLLALLLTVAISACTPDKPAEKSIVIEMLRYEVVSVAPYQVKVVELKSRHAYWIECPEVFPNVSVGSRWNIRTETWRDGIEIKSTIRGHWVCSAESQK